jgi:tetratricopeptide (TPR) repeat protein
LGNDHSYTAYGHYTLARTLFRQARYADARAHYAEAWRIRRHAEGPATMGAMEAQVGLAKSLAALGRHDEALPILEEWIERQAAHFGEGPELAAALERQAAALAAAGYDREAAAIRERVARPAGSPPVAGGG